MRNCAKRRSAVRDSSGTRRPIKFPFARNQATAIPCSKQSSSASAVIWTRPTKAISSSRCGSTSSKRRWRSGQRPRPIGVFVERYHDRADRTTDDRSGFCDVQSGHGAITWETAEMVRAGGICAMYSLTNSVCSVPRAEVSMRKGNSSSPLLYRTVMTPLALSIILTTSPPKAAVS